MKEAVTEPSQGEECSICLDDISAPLRGVLACGHSFHVDCIIRWGGSSQAKCPLCRVCFNSVKYNGEDLGIDAGIGSDDDDDEGDSSTSDSDESWNDGRNNRRHTRNYNRAGESEDGRENDNIEEAEEAEEDDHGDGFLESTGEGDEEYNEDEDHEVTEETIYLPSSSRPRRLQAASAGVISRPTGAPARPRRDSRQRAREERGVHARHGRAGVVDRIRAARSVEERLRAAREALFPRERPGTTGGALLAAIPEPIHLDRDSWRLPTTTSSTFIGSKKRKLTSVAQAALQMMRDEDQVAEEALAAAERVERQSQVQVDIDRLPRFHGRRPGYKRKRQCGEEQEKECGVGDGVAERAPEMRMAMLASTHGVSRDVSRDITMIDHLFTNADSEGVVVYVSEALCQWQQGSSSLRHLWLKFIGARPSFVRSLMEQGLAHVATVQLHVLLRDFKDQQRTTNDDDKLWHLGELEVCLRALNTVPMKRRHLLASLDGIQGAPSVLTTHMETLRATEGPELDAMSSRMQRLQGKPGKKVQREMPLLQMFMRIHQVCERVLADMDGSNVGFVCGTSRSAYRRVVNLVKRLASSWSDIVDEDS